MKKKGLGERREKGGSFSYIENENRSTMMSDRA